MKKELKSKLIENVSWCKYGEIISCPFCSSHSSKQHIYEEYNWVTLNLVTCIDCGHIYSNPRPTKESLFEYYSSQYLKHSGVMLPTTKSDIFQPNSLWSKKMKRYDYYLSLLPINNKKEPKILDIGCSWGGLLTSASKYFNTNSLLGVDVSSKAIDFITEQMKFQGFQGTLIDYTKNSTEKFDYIFSSHSLEHSLNPKQELVLIERLLNKDGTFFLTIPNHSSFMTDEMKGYSPAVRGGNHYHFFNHNFLSSELLKLGFTVLRSFTSSLFSPHIETLNSLLNMKQQDKQQMNIKDLDEKYQGEFLYFILKKTNSIL